VDRLELCWQGGRPIVAGVRLESGETMRADAFVIAAPLHSARRMIPPMLRHIDYFDSLWKLKSVPVINVQVWFDRYVSHTDNLFFTADAPFSVFADLAITSPLYDHTGGSLVSMAVAPAQPLWHLSDHQIAEHCVSALHNLWPHTRHARIVHKVVVKIPNSIYREVPGSDALRPTQQTPIPNLALAGDYTRQDYMASMEGAVRSGHRAAQALIEGVSIESNGKSGRIREPIMQRGREGYAKRSYRTAGQTSNKPGN
jgi:uncharacterized protein with NAD-binding domain and iron-sulfur cluster